MTSGPRTVGFIRIVRVLGPTSPEGCWEPQIATVAMELYFAMHGLERPDGCQTLSDWVTSPAERNDFCADFSDCFQ